jgi:hypothetical protein
MTYPGSVLRRESQGGGVPIVLGGKSGQDVEQQRFARLIPLGCGDARNYLDGSANDSARFAMPGPVILFSSKIAQPFSNTGNRSLHGRSSKRAL